MCRFAGRDLWPTGLTLSVCVLIAATKNQIQAATLSLAGISEGSRVTLPASVSSTNLFFQASISGIGGSPPVEFALDGNGTTLARATSAPPYGVTFNNLSSGKYFLTARVANSPEIASDVSFDVVPASLSPANDSWNQAEIIANVSVAAVGTNVYATREPDEPFLPNAAGRSVWWSWRANVNGPVTATTVGSAFDTTLAVYRGTNLAALTLMGANDDVEAVNAAFSQVTFNAEAGADYYLAVDGSIAADGSSVGGEARLRVVDGTPPVVAVAFPSNGSGFLVPLPSFTTNVSVSASLSSSSGIERVEYLLDGDLPAPLGGVIQPPYRWPLENLLPGNYWLSITATGSNALVSVAHVGFSVVSLSPAVQLVDSPGTSPGALPIGVTGLKGTNYTLQSSANLIEWSELKHWTNFPGAELVIDTNTPARGTQFYRAALP